MLAEYPQAAARTKLLAEMRACLVADLASYAEERAADDAAEGLGLFRLSIIAARMGYGESPLPPWTEAEDALALLDADPDAFLQTYFQAGAMNTASKGLHSMSSR